jgi:hypothetical protein
MIAAQRFSRLTCERVGLDREELVWRRQTQKLGGDGDNRRNVAGFNIVFYLYNLFKYLICYVINLLMGALHYAFETWFRNRYQELPEQNGYIHN